MSETTATDKSIVNLILQNKHWHHDIEYIDGEFVEVVVKKYQDTKDDDLLAKIVKNYSIFRGLWANELSKYLDNEIEAGEAMHDEIIWLASCKFNRTKTIKRDGKAFNAYVVSALLNQLKNQRNAKMSHKNHPRIKCPICAEEVYQIDARHLAHAYDLDRYKRDFPNHALVSTDGMTVCPITGEVVKEVTVEYVNRIAFPDGSRGYYTTNDYRKEFASVIPKGPFICPVTNMELDSVDLNYPSTLAKGYTVKAFIEDFPDFKAVFTCPISKDKVLEIDQAYLDKTLGQKPSNQRKTLENVIALFPNATLRAVSVQVLNPYTNQIVDSITPSMLKDAKTNIQEHLEKFGTLTLDKWNPNLISCPFTGRKTHMMKRDLLPSIGRTPFDFFLTTCKSPLRSWNVKCAICGDLVHSIWGHLDTAKHSYAKRQDIEEFSSAYPAYPMKAVISTNAFHETDEGNHVHISDLLCQKIKVSDPLDIEDSLLKAAEDAVDERIARAMRDSRTMEDVCYLATIKKKIIVKDKDKFSSLKDALSSIIGDDDFDMLDSNENGVEVSIPCRETIKKKLLRLYQESDLMDDVNTRKGSS